MKPLLKLSLWAATLSILGTGCSDTPSVAGGGSDHPNEIKATVLTVSGAPAAGARVTVWRKNSISSLVGAEQLTLIDSLRGDSEGKIELNLPEGTFALEVLSADSNEIAYFNSVVIEQNRPIYLIDLGANKVDSTAELKKIQLQKTATLSGTVLASKRTPLRVELSDFPRTASVDRQGNFKFLHLPPRRVGISTLHHSGTDTARTFHFSRTLKSGEHLKLTPITVTPGEVLIDDFEDGDGQIAWASLFGEGWWYTYQQPWGSILGHPEGLVDLSQAITAVNGSRALHIAVQFPEEVIPPTLTPLALVGFNLGTGYMQNEPLTGKSFFNLTSATDLSFRVQGTGKMRVQIATKATKEADGWGHFFSEEISLPSSGYKEIRVPLNSLLPPPGSMADSLKMDWEQVRHRAYAVDLMFTSTAEMWLDDIKLLGVEIDDL